MEQNTQTGKKRSRARRKRRAPRRVPLSVVLAAVFVVLATGSMLNRRAEQEAKEAQARLTNARYEMQKLEMRRSELSEQIKLAETDDFIASQARTKYGYLADGEIRFVITNPSVLWGPEGPPPEFRNTPKP